MKEYKSSNYYIRRRDALLKRLARIRPFLSGSLVDIECTCGNVGCRCHKKGPKHIGRYLMWKEENKTRGIYIPKDLREDADKWHEEYNILRGIIQDVNELQRIIIRKYVKEKRWRAKHAKGIF